MRGRKAKPTALKVLEGNRGKRKLNKREPKPAPGIPACPRSLSRRARQEWKRVTPELDRLGLLTVVDRAALAGYCQSWADYCEAVEWMEKNGRVMTVRDDKGNVRFTQAVPQFGIAVKSLDRVRAFASEFGLTPASRTRLSIAEDTEKIDPLELAIR